MACYLSRGELYHQDWPDYPILFLDGSALYMIGTRVQYLKEKFPQYFNGKIDIESLCRCGGYLVVKNQKFGSGEISVAPVNEAGYQFVISIDPVFKGDKESVAIIKGIVMSLFYDRSFLGEKPKPIGDFAKHCPKDFICHLNIHPMINRLCGVFVANLYAAKTPSQAKVV